MKKILIGNITLAYKDQGEGEPVIFIHGFPASSYSWRKVTQAFSPTHRTICFDLMGFGASDKPRDEDYSLDRQCRLVKEAISQLGLTRAILVGHSMGGGVCLSLMRKLGAQSDIISGLVLINTVCYPQPLPWFMHALKVPILPKLGMKLLPEELGFRLLERAMYHPSNGMNPGAVREYARALRSKGAHSALITVARQIMPADIDDFVASYTDIHIPTQIIWGNQDRVVPLRFGKRLAADLKNARLSEVDGCGHCPQEEKPEQVIKVMQDFIGSLKQAQLLRLAKRHML